MAFDFDSNVIDLNSRRKVSESQEGSAQPLEVGQAPIVDMAERRQEILNSERRQVKRTILTEFIGVFAVIPEKGLSEVSLYDISEDGMSFDTGFDKGSLAEGEEIAMRIYMNQHTYFPFSLKMANIREITEEGVFRHGGNFVKGSVNREALHHFIKFIENISSCLQRDNGDILVTNILK